MSDLKAQILARIDLTPYRPPTSRDIIQRLYPATYLEIMDALKQLIDAREIDTETGDSGTTYTRRKVHVPSEKKPSAPTHESIAPWPRKSVALISPSADCMDKYKRKIAATKERIRAVMTQPMTAKQYAKAAGIKLNPANQMLQRYAETGFLAVERKRPFCYRVANPC